MILEWNSKKNHDFNNSGVELLNFHDFHYHDMKLYEINEMTKCQETQLRYMHILNIHESY